MCYFCGQELEGEACNNHHLIPRRYFKRGSDCNANNVVRVHQVCHMEWHRRHDKPKFRLGPFMDHMKRLGWGEGIFAA